MARYHWLRKPLPGDLVSSQELHFTYSQLNFGVVQVNFNDPQHPKVRFEIYGPDGRIKEFVDTERN